ncbi:hypothetical protein LINPERPRIM_LOCUS21011 [Linum perenne]
MRVDKTIEYCSTGAEE